MLECLKQEEKLALLKRISVGHSLIWSSPLSDYHCVTASNQFAMPAMSYFKWTQHWPITELSEINIEDCKIVVENGGKHPCGSTYIPARR